jgi:L-serine dehydratase
MYVSIFEIFKIGIGPSSSHTVGPIKAANEFITLLTTTGMIEKVAEVKVELYGSLALTGRGHGTDKAIIIGLMGEHADTVDPDNIPAQRKAIEESGQLHLGGTRPIAFKEPEHIIFHFSEMLPKHTNGMRFTAYDANKQELLNEIYYSVGGGFVVTDAQFGCPPSEAKPIPFPFTTADELFTLCRENNLGISQLMMSNEKVFHTESEVKEGLLRIAAVMEACLRKGCQSEGILPGGLNVQRRAAMLYKKLTGKEKIIPEQHRMMNFLNAYAMAVNEENAAGGRVVTAPTNGAAGIVPAVLQYYKEFCDSPTDEGVIDFILTAGAIAILYKLQASISGAEVGCQGEVGVACSMAAGALTAVLGGTLLQIECAAEIGMEHNLGLTCDPPKGLVQIPCIERNAMASVKAVNATYLALAEDGLHHKISLDTVIKTMKRTGDDMMSIYKETSLGGLAVNIPEC